MAYFVRPLSVPCATLKVELSVLASYGPLAQQELQTDQARHLRRENTEQEGARQVIAKCNLRKDRDCNLRWEEAFRRND
jgi:hypothetical protein